MAQRKEIYQAHTQYLLVDIFIAGFGHMGFFDNKKKIYIYTVYIAYNINTDILVF